MRVLFNFLILPLAVVRGDAGLRSGTKIPQLGADRGAMLAPRADSGAVASEICGYLGGQINQPWVCAVDSLYCVVEPIEGVVGCCYSNYCGAFRTACIAQTDPCDAACSSNDQNLICVGSKPLCATYSYASDVTEVRCESTIPSILSVAYTYTGFSTPILLPRVAAGFSITSQGAGFSYLSLQTGTQNPPSSTAAPSSTLSSTFATSTSTSTISSPSTTSTSTLSTSTLTLSTSTSTLSTSSTTSSTNTASSPISATSPNTSSATSSTATIIYSNTTPVGAIVGGVLGGLAIIAAFAALVLLLRYKNQKSKQSLLYPQMAGNPAMASELPTGPGIPENDPKKHQTWSSVSNGKVPPEGNQYVPPLRRESELPGQTRWS